LSCTGAVGIPGPRGTPGNPGPPGFAGQPGATGFTGWTGQQGIPGIKGRPGFSSKKNCIAYLSLIYEMLLLSNVNNIEIARAYFVYYIILSSVVTCNNV